MLSLQLREKLLSLSTPLLVDARVRLGLSESHLDPGIRPAVPFTRMAGTAVTVRLEMATDEFPADLALLADTYESQSLESYSIMVIQVPEELRGYGIVGEGGATLARAHGFVGALIEGAARDSHDLRDMKFPVFSRMIAPGYIHGKALAVAANEPVVIGARTIYAGDVVVGDNDGVIVVRPEELSDVVAKAQAIREWEHGVNAAFAAGQSAKEALAVGGEMP